MAKKVIEKSIEESLLQACDKLRGSVESSEYKHVVLGLIFLKFASDKFEEAKELADKFDSEYNKFRKGEINWPSLSFNNYGEQWMNN